MTSSRSGATESTLVDRRDVLRSIYRKACAYVTCLGYEGEVMWYRSLDPRRITEQDFLRESAWVVLSSGFRESTVRKVFGYVSLCFFDWISAREISANAKECVALARRRFGHDGKLGALCEIASKVSLQGFDSIKAEFLKAPVLTLQQFPYIGPITSRHLAKNLGIPTAKPDRHLQRLARSLGFDHADSLCKEMGIVVGEMPHVVDTVLWRFCASGGVLHEEMA